MTQTQRLIDLEPYFEQYEKGSLDLPGTCQAIANVLHQYKLDYFAAAFVKAGETGDPNRADEVLDELLRFGESAQIKFSTAG